MNRRQLDLLLKKIENTEHGGDERVKEIVNRLVRDLFYLIEDLDIQPAEFWKAITFLTEAGKNQEYGLIAPGLGFEHLLDLRMDEAELLAGIKGGTPRTIEGPLYVAGAPVSNGFARLDDGKEIDRGETLFMEGRVTDLNGNPVPNALVEVWHANLDGRYSFFDPSQSDFNHRKGIRTDANGRYQFRTIIPNGYSVPPNGSTDQLLKALGRHGTRPAHIHYFVSATGYRKLTTQINIEGDPYLWDDFAFATREGLVPAIKRITNSQAKVRFGIDKAVAMSEFNIQLHPENKDIFDTDIERARVGS